MTGTTTNTGAGDLTLNYLSSGQIFINGAITASGTGKINVLAQSFYVTNNLTACSSGNCGNIVNGTSGPIITKGGYVVFDATGGSISGTTITPGSYTNAPVYLNAGINTTSTGLATNSSGGDFSLAAAIGVANGGGSFGPVGTLSINVGGNFNAKLVANSGHMVML